jgi:probable blue pigment (indigoidine) exporter
MKRHVFLTALTPIFFGTTYAVTALALPPDRPLFTAAVRALPAGALLLLASRERPRGWWWGRLAILGALNIAAVFALVFVAAYRMPGGVAAVIGGVQPLVVVLLAAGVLGERLHVRGLLAALAGVAGVALLVLRSAVPLDPVGIAAAAGATICGALGIILVKHWGRPMPMLAFVGWQLVAGGAILVALAAAFEGTPPSLDARNVAAFAYLAGCSTLLAYVLWFRGVERLGPAPVSLLALLNPLTAAVLGAVLMDERYTPAQLLGGLLILAAILFGVRRQSRRFDSSSRAATEHEPKR